jgi:O-antigen ligase
VGPTAEAARRVAVPWAIALSVLAFAAGSSSVHGAVRVGGPLRWVFLFVLAGVGIALAGARAVAALGASAFARFVAGLAAFGVLALLSTAWSVDPSLTFQRAASFCVLLLAAATLAIGLRPREIFVGIAGGAAAVAVLSLVLLVIDHDAAVQPATAGSGWRFRGFGMNPNTAAMLYALALVPTIWLACSESGRARAAWALASLLLYVEIVLSQSRGALVAALAAGVVGAYLLMPLGRRLAVVLVAIAAAFAIGISVRIDASAPVAGRGPAVVPPPSSLPAGCSKAPCSANETRLRRLYPDFLGVFPSRPQDEIGHPALGDAASSTGSGRVDAWKGALRQARSRPVLGYGFGTEAKVFVDRWYFFEGNLPENSYIGLLLQVGVVGLLLFAVPLFVVSFVAVFRRRAIGAERAVAAAVVCGGLVLMLVQSFAYSVGNIATLPFWLSAFVLAAGRSS